MIPLCFEQGNWSQNMWNQEDCIDAPRLVAQRHRQGFLASVTWVRASTCTPVTPAVSYLPTGLAGCSVGPGISCGARKLTRTLQVTKKKKRLHRSSTSNRFHDTNPTFNRKQLEVWKSKRNRQEIQIKI